MLMHACIYNTIRNVFFQLGLFQLVIVVAISIDDYFSFCLVGAFVRVCAYRMLGLALFADSNTINDDDDDDNHFNV